MKVKCLFLCIMVAIALLSGCSAPAARTAQPGNTTESSASAKSATPVIPAPFPALTATATPDATPAAAHKTAAPASNENGKVAIAEGFYYMKLTDEIKKRITGMSFPADVNESKITYGQLRYIRLKYYDFGGAVHDDGELIVNAKLAEEVTQIFYELYKAKYPFTSIRLVDDYGEPGDDNLSMAANNTSAFNYRYVTGTQTLSLHSYGNAIDINPRLNPYINGKKISPPSSAKYADRSLKLPGMIDHEDLCYKLFTQNGWKWGGDSEGDKDYQHFSKNLGV